MSDEATQQLSLGPAEPDIPEPEEELADQLVADAEEPLADTAKKIEVALPPGVKLASNLDTYEREAPEKPFWFQHEGEFFRMMDPEDVDLTDILVGQENPRLMLHVLLDESHRDRFFTKKMPMGKMKKLVKDYQTHYGMTDLGELAGSARSSSGTRGR
jgi:hypothetical protein